MDPVSTIVITTALQAGIQAIAERGINEGWDLGEKSLSSIVKRLSGKDLSSQRSQALQEAVERAITDTTRLNLTSQIVLFSLIESVRADTRQTFSRDVTTAWLFGERPDLEILVQLSQQHLQYRAGLSDDVVVPSREDTHNILETFVSKLRDHLLDQPLLRELVRDREHITLLRKICAELKPAEDTESTYLKQVIKIDSQLRFAGIPHLRDNQPVNVTDLFHIEL